MTPETPSEHSVEAKGASLDEAKSAAAAMLGAAATEIEVLHSEELEGLFGRKEVRIVAALKLAPAKKAPAQRGRKTAPAAEPEAEEAPVEPPKPKKAPARAKKPEPVVEASGDDEGVQIEATSEIAQKYVDLLEEILELAHLDASVRVAGLQGRYANLEVDGADASYLVGRKGETLNAVQYLLNVIGVHSFGEGVRVSLEADDYRKRRAEVLEKLARDIAAEVLKRGEEAVLDALPAFERRIVHQTLSEIEGVTTYSEGEEPERRVVIAPAE